MKLSRLITLLLVAVAAWGVVWFYYWTVGFQRVFAGPQSDYYNLLVDGFQEGSLAMKVAPGPDGQLPFKLDASRYQGKYYLYFGVTPALLLFWPWTVITGHDLPEGVAAATLAALAFALAVGWVATLWRRFFPKQGGASWPLVVLFLGLGTGAAVVLRRPLFYEIAIFSGLACTLGCLWSLTLAVLQPGRQRAWLAVASLAAGLATGSRPTYVPGAVVALGVVAGFLWWRDRPQARTPALRAAVRIGLPAFIPLGVILAGLAWYNWARFGSPFEFGIHYQVGSNANGVPFTFAALFRNLARYYGTPPSFSWFFPFFAPGPKPLGSYQEQVHGQFFWLLLGLLGVIGLIIAWRRRKLEPELGVLIGAALAWGVATLVFVCMSPWHTNRYQLDFHPVFTITALLGLLAWARTASWTGLLVWRLALVWGVFLAGYSTCTSFHVHGFFRGSRPEQYEQVARVADRLVWPLHRLAGDRLGGMELVVRFGAGTPGVLEPLVVMGGGPDMDALLVKYTTPGRARLVFSHLNYGEVESEEFDLKPGQARWLKFHVGSLYPPAWHPWYRSQPRDMARAANRVSVKMDGVEILERDVNCYQASANQVRLGERNGFLLGEPRFSGEIERVRGLKADTAWLQGIKERKGPRHLRLLLPRDRFGLTEPLLLAGELRRTEFLSVTYVRPGVFRLTFIHEGWSTPLTSPDIEWDYLQPLDVLVDLGPDRLADTVQRERADGVTVEAAGQIVISHDFETHPMQPELAHVGCTPWLMSESRTMFGGHILPEPPPGVEPAPLRRAKQALLAGMPVELRVTLPGRTANQPIFTTGSTGAGDGLFIEFLSDSEIRFGFDHWGSQATYSAPVRIKPGHGHRLTVSLGARVSAQATMPGHLRVQLDGRPVIDQPVDLFPADRERLFFGGNPIGLSTSGPEFTGRMELSDRARPAPAVTNP